MNKQKSCRTSLMRQRFFSSRPDANYCALGAAALGAAGAVAAGAFGAAAGAGAAAFVAGAAAFLTRWQYGDCTLPVFTFALVGFVYAHSALAAQAASSNFAQGEGAFFSTFALAAAGAAGAAAFGAAGAAGAAAGALGAGASCALADATRSPSDAVAAATPIAQRVIVLFTALISNGWCRFDV